MFYEVFIAIAKDMQPGRLAESLIFLGVLLWRINPHLKKIEDRLKGLEIAVANGFKSGEDRFIKIEGRITALETKKELVNENTCEA